MSEEKGNVSTVAALFNLTPDGVYDLRRRNIIPRPVVEGQWDIAACTKRYIAYLQTKHSEAGKEDRARILKSEANIAEKKDAELDGRLCDLSQCIADVEDMMTRCASEIGKMKSLNLAQKKAVLKILRDDAPLSRVAGRANQAER